MANIVTVKSHKLNPALVTLVVIAVLTVLTAVLYFYLYGKVIAKYPQYNLLQYLQQSGGGGGGGA
jgi:ABC-type transporter Mla subunit MlaD